MSAHFDYPIGVFDSGVGGLTVVQALMQRLPQESILYFGDTARVPYGVKSDETVRHYAQQITGFLLEKQVKLLIVACNTMAAVASTVIHEMSSVPVLDVIDAGARRAAAHDAKRVGVIGTLATVNSGAYETAIHRYAPHAQVLTRACPLFVPLVEEGWLEHPATRLTAETYLQPLQEAEIDTLVLGCTHYPLLKPLLAQVMGARVHLVDSAETVAESTAQLLVADSLANSPTASPEHHFFVTDVPQRFQQVGERFLKRPLNNVHLIKW